MHPVPRLDAAHANPEQGTVRLSWPKLLWFGGHGLATLAALAFITPGALLLFVASTWLLVLLGHSLGYHRLLMHGNFKTSRALGRAFLAAGACLGTAGPSRIIALHDVRDWAQRSPRCHPFHSQHTTFWRDMGWQLFCRLDLDAPPRFLPDPVWGDDPFARHLDRWWRVWALAPAVPLFLLGGWGWVVWGVSARIFVTNAAHWAVNHVCHDPARDHRHWDVPGNGVAASDLTPANPVTGFLLGLVTAGECWHSNHHAFPESANVALAPHQFDTGYVLLKALEQLGLVWDVREARPEDQRTDLLPLSVPLV